MNFEIEMKPFKIIPFDRYDKYIQVTGPGTAFVPFFMTIDFDDVDHATIEKYTYRIVRILNKYWNDLDEL